MAEEKMISTGTKQLDDLTGGLKLGDNVVWQVANGVPVEYFTRSFFRENKDFRDKVIFISFNYSPHTIFKRYDYIFPGENIILIDAFTHGKGNSDPVFLDFYHEDHTNPENFICVDNPKDTSSFIKILNEVENKNQDGSFYIFDSLTGMNELWKDEAAVLDFFAFTCPKLYNLNTLAYWVFEKDAHSKEFIAGITHITQIVFSLRATNSDYFELKIKKLEDRPSFHEIGPNYFKIINQSIQFQDKRFEDIFKIGEKVKEQRKIMKITQAELASSLGMTPGAISQIENGITAPSLHTLVQLSSIFNKPIEHFIGTESSQKAHSNYTVSKQGLQITSSHRNLTISRLLEDENSSVKPYSIVIKGGKTIEGPILLHKGNEFITVVQGSLSISIDNEIIFLEKGDSILIKSSFIDNWENRVDTDTEFIYLQL
ncbi:MAG: helix-turn-helix domain-containing protein [bacterium]|nr:helix-turn-helix domain-containing protein [bacterium]